MALSALLGLAVVSVIKILSNTSCPWDLAEFGGVARYASHWALGVIDGGGGRCFPGGQLPRQVLRLWGLLCAAPQANPLRHGGGWRARCSWAWCWVARGRCAVRIS